MLVCHFNHRLVRDDTTDPGLQRLVVDTGGDVPDMRPIIGRHMLASFTLEVFPHPCCYFWSAVASPKQPREVFIARVSGIVVSDFEVSQLLLCRRGFGSCRGDGYARLWLV